MKALKVADLKVYLQKAGLDTNGKKQDLVNRILENKSARDIFEPPTDATPEVQPAAAPSEPAPATPTPVIPAPAADPPRTPAPAATQTTPASAKAKDVNDASAAPATAPAVNETADEDIEKRRKRAERFGIPFVEKPANGSNNPTTVDERKKARAERFGIPAVAGVKREQNGEVNAEEEERRRKRAERFQIKKEE